MHERKDAQWWIAEAQRHPDKAAELIRMLADRLAFVDRQNEELRGELIALRRKGASADAPQVRDLQEKVSTLEATLRQVSGAGYLFAWAKGQILVNRTLQDALDDGLPTETARHITGAIVTTADARLLAISETSRAFALRRSELPAPDETPITVDAPRDIVAYVDQAIFESCRYLILRSRGGFLYSVLAGVAARAAQRQDYLIRNLMPEDPIIAAYPSNNADVFSISRGARWLRFPESALPGTGARGIELPRDDALAGLTWISGTIPHVFIISTDGRLFVRESRDLPARRAPGRAAGTLLTGAEVAAAGHGAHVLVLTERGTAIDQSLDPFPPRAITETGHPLSGFGAQDKITAVMFY